MDRDSSDDECYTPNEAPPITLSAILESRSSPDHLPVNAAFPSATCAFSPIAQPPSASVSRSPSPDAYLHCATCTVFLCYSHSELKCHYASRHGIHLCASTACTAVFANQRDCTKHFKSKHSTTNFKCPKEGCEFVTKYRGSLRNHANNIHATKKTIPCGECR